MPCIGTQPNDVKKNTGLYTPSEILELTKDGNWGGSLELIEEQTVSGTPSSLDFINLANNPYDVYLVQMSNFIASAQTQVIFRFSNDNGTTFEAGASAYQFASQRMITNGGFAESRSTGTTYIGTDVYTNTSTSNLNGYFYLYNLLDSSKYSFLTQQLSSILVANGRTSFGGGVYPTAETINAFQILAGTSTWTSGTAKLYGVKQL
jgi:hypothetical protein